MSYFTLWCHHVYVSEMYQKEPWRICDKAWKKEHRISKWRSRKAPFSKARNLGYILKLYMVNLWNLNSSPWKMMPILDHHLCDMLICWCFLLYASSSFMLVLKLMLGPEKMVLQRSACLQTAFKSTYSSLIDWNTSIINTHTMHILCTFLQNSCWTAVHISEHETI